MYSEILSNPNSICGYRKIADYYKSKGIQHLHSSFLKLIEIKFKKNELNNSNNYEK